MDKPELGLWVGLPWKNDGCEMGHGNNEEGRRKHGPWTVGRWREHGKLLFNIPSVDFAYFKKYHNKSCVGLLVKSSVSS